MAETTEEEATEGLTAQQIKIARTVVTATWIFAIASFFYPFYYWSSGGLGRAFFGILVAVHAVELLLFFKTYSRAPGSLSRHILLHMLFGVVYHTQVKQEIGKRA